MGRIEQKYAAEVAVVGVHTGKFTAEHDTRLIRSAVQRYHLSHPVVNDRDFAIWKSYATRAWPTLFFIDPRGYVIGKHEGEISFAALDRVLAQMVAEFDAEGLLDRRLLEFAAEAGAGGPLLFPGAVAVDPAADRLVIADSGHHRLLVAGLDGRVRAVYGDGAPGLADGAAARFNRPQGLALDGDTLYVADSHNHAIRRVDLAAGRVETIAGTGEKGEGVRTPGPALQTALRSPWDVLAMDGRLIIAMAGSHQVWALDLAAGEIGVLAGAGPERLDDGSFAAATFAQPFGICTGGGVLYVADSESSAIRALDLAARQVRTLVGEGLFEWGDRDGVGAEVRLQHPGGVAWHQGSVWIADTYNHKIKRLDPERRRVDTVAGSGEMGHADGTGPAAGLHEPAGLCAAGGLLYVADAGNHAVRILNPAGGEVRTLEISL